MTSPRGGAFIDTGQIQQRNSFALEWKGRQVSYDIFPVDFASVEGTEYSQQEMARAMKLVEGAWHSQREMARGMRLISTPAVQRERRGPLFSFQYFFIIVKTMTGKKHDIFLSVVGFDKVCDIEAESKDREERQAW